MCMFSRAVERVSGTQMFARRLAGDRQGLVYAMTIVAAEPVAMCLPLPVVPGGGEDAVAFVDLSHYPVFFDDCEEAFPPPASAPGFLASRGDFSLKTLAVHAVGDFVASYVPSPRDFERLDPRFRLPATALAQLPQYADYGFAVFQLAAPHAAAGSKRWWQFWKPAAPAAGDPERTIHPMALTFPSRHGDGALFFPTLHLHDGDHVPAKATYDHTLYCQTADARLARTLPWSGSPKRLGKVVDAAKTGGLVDGDAVAYRTSIHALTDNVDHLFVPPACTPANLSVRDAHFGFDLAASAAYDMAPGSDRARAQQATARTSLDALSAGLAAGLRTLCSEHAAAWNLAPLPDDISTSTLALMNGGVPMAMTERGPVAIEPGSGPTPTVLRLHVETGRVETQAIAFAFRGAPARETIAAIEAALPAVVDRALA